MTTWTKTNTTPPAKTTTKKSKTSCSKKSQLLISKKSTNQILLGLKKFKKLIETAKKRWLNESDTSNIINDFLWEVLWYDKYFDVTTEYKIKWQYCDYWIIMNWKLTLLMEVKQIWLDLNENHIFQAISYAWNEWVKRVILTNLRRRELFYLSFWDKIEKELILDFDILWESSTNKLLENLQYIHKESLQKNYLWKLLKQKMALSERNIRKVLFSDPVIKKIQSEIKTTTWLKTSKEEVINILKDYVDN
jgi:hypothetical protein